MRASTERPAPPAVDSPRADASPRRVHFICNGVFTDAVGGGNVYFSQMARAAQSAGWTVHFIGGPALRRYLANDGLQTEFTQLDADETGLNAAATTAQGFQLLWDFIKRTARCFRRRHEMIAPVEMAYAISEYWFDAIPLFFCRARARVMYLGMIAPTFGQVIFRRRGDVTSNRLPALYYWASQQFSLRLLRRARNKAVTYGHPEMRDYLLRFGYRPEELFFVSNGMDVETAQRTPNAAKEYDVVWTGRVHPQKGIDDLLATLVHCADRLPGFRALIIGKSKTALEPEIKRRGLERNVAFSGLVSEEEKFRLLKSARVFAMPSHYEGWGIVVGEALAAGVPVVAYDLPPYRGVFGDFVRYVPCFDLPVFTRAVEREVAAAREGLNYLREMDLPGLTRSLSWAESRRQYQSMLATMDERCPAGRAGRS